MYKMVRDQDVTRGGSINRTVRSDFRKERNAVATSHGTARHARHIALLSSTWLLLITVSGCGVATGTAAPTPAEVGQPLTASAITVVPQATAIPMKSNSAQEKPAAQQRAAVATTPALQAGADLESLLFQPGDLPDGTTAAHSDNPSPINFEDNPPAATIVGLTFATENWGAGSVSVLLYTSGADVSSAFTRLTESVLRDEASAGAKPQPKPAIGEQARAAQLTLASSTYGKDTVSVVTFTRCRALVDIRLNGRAGMTIETALAYAKALDTRLTPKVCQ